MGTLSETLDNLYTTTWQNMKKTVGDNIFDGTPFWFWLRANGGIDTAEGGRFLTEPLRFAKSDNLKFIGKGDTVALADKEFMTIAKYDWGYLADSIVRFGVDDQQNRGRNQIISLMTSKLENSQDSMTDKLEEVLMDTNTADAKQFNGIMDIVPDDPTVTGSTLGGIDPSVDTWWRNQENDIAGDSFTALGIGHMTNMMNLCMKNLRMDAPNIIVCGLQPYEFYDVEVTEQRRVVNRTLGDAGFQNVEFRGVPLVWTPAQATNDAMYFLNTRYLKFRYDPQMFFDMTEWKSIPNQVNDKAAQIVLAGQFVTGRRRVHGVMFNIDTV